MENFYRTFSLLRKRLGINWTPNATMTDDTMIKQTQSALRERKQKQSCNIVWLSLSDTHYIDDSAGMTPPYLIQDPLICILTEQYLIFFSSLSLFLPRASCRVRTERSQILTHFHWGEYLQLEWEGRDVFISSI